MSLYQTIRTKTANALKAGNEYEKNLLKVVLGECQRSVTGDEPTDEAVKAVIKKLITTAKQNQETYLAKFGIGHPAWAEAAREVNHLFTLIPDCLTLGQVGGYLLGQYDQIMAAKNDGQATGVANKHLKGLGLDYFGDDVKTCVEAMRKGHAQMLVLPGMKITQTPAD